VVKERKYRQVTEPSTLKKSFKPLCSPTSEIPTQEPPRWKAHRKMFESEEILITIVIIPINKKDSGTDINLRKKGKGVPPYQTVDTPMMNITSREMTTWSAQRHTPRVRSANANFCTGSIFLSREA